jgi:hypothetical protein
MVSFDITAYRPLLRPACEQEGDRRGFRLGVHELRATISNALLHLIVRTKVKPVTLG